MKKFLDSLKREKSRGVFNPWFDIDEENDIDSQSPVKRFENLKTYLGERKNAGYLLIAEALGYQGGHFSGIAMTSERIITGKCIHKGILPEHVTNIQLAKTSSKPEGFNEPTATIVWGKIIELGIDTRDVVLWNAFPWHPYKPEGGYLTNRTPSDAELEEGKIVLLNMLNEFKFKKIIALGKKSEATLGNMGIKADSVRHPANGGATEFRKGLELFTR